MVPEPDVVDGALVIGYVLRSGCLLSRKGLLLDAIQGECLPGELDIIFNILCLPSQLIGLDLEALDKRREYRANDYGGGYPSTDTV